ncbi:MAG: tol-pal system protein YbgF, partial [Methylococcales bacterium]
AARVTRLEYLQSGQAISEMLDRIDRLQNEVQQLHGSIDEIRHNVDRMQDRHQNFYLDLDKRLLRLEESPGNPIEPAPRDSTAGIDFEQSDNTQVPATETEVVTPPRQAEPQTSSESNPEPTEPAPDTSSATPVENRPESQDAEKLYQEAFVIFNAGRYDDAIASFSRVIESSPTGEFADNAQYWLGETYYVKRDFDAARSNFSQVMEKYPTSNKIPDAILKLGFIEYETSNWKSAREILNSLIEQYPASNAAQLAQDRLNRMKKEKH